LVCTADVAQGALSGRLITLSAVTPKCENIKRLVISISASFLRRDIRHVPNIAFALFHLNTGQD
jgi:hypothetical protein